MSANSASASAADPPGPVVRKNHFRGLLFKYGPKPIQVRGSLIVYVTDLGILIRILFSFDLFNLI